MELYVDRPRDTWTWRGDHVVMTTEYIDPARFVAEHMPATEEPSGGSSVSVGHVHLEVGDVPTARKFYVDTVGFDETARMGNSALFVSAGKYHHHMAMNMWGSAGAGFRAPSLGLGRVDVVVPSRDDVAVTTDRLRLAGFPIRDDGSSVETNDPWGNIVRFTPAK